MDNDFTSKNDQLGTDKNADYLTNSISNNSQHAIINSNGSDTQDDTNTTVDTIEKVRPEHLTLMETLENLQNDLISENINKKPVILLDQKGSPSVATPLDLNDQEIMLNNLISHCLSPVINSNEMSDTVARDSIEDDAIKNRQPEAIKEDPEVKLDLYSDKTESLKITAKTNRKLFTREKQRITRTNKTGLVSNGYLSDKIMLDAVQNKRNIYEDDRAEVLMPNTNVTEYSTIDTSSLCLLQNMDGLSLNKRRSEELISKNSSSSSIKADSVVNALGEVSSESDINTLFDLSETRAMNNTFLEELFRDDLQLGKHQHGDMTDNADQNGDVMLLNGLRNASDISPTDTSARPRDYRFLEDVIGDSPLQSVGLQPVTTKTSADVNRSDSEVKPEDILASLVRDLMGDSEDDTLDLTHKNGPSSNHEEFILKRNLLPMPGLIIDQRLKRSRLLKIRTCSPKKTPASATAVESSQKPYIHDCDLHGSMYNRQQSCSLSDSSNSGEPNQRNSCHDNIKYLNSDGHINVPGCSGGSVSSDELSGTDKTITKVKSTDSTDSLDTEMNSLPSSDWGVKLMGIATTEKVDPRLHMYKEGSLLSAAKIAKIRQESDLLLYKSVKDKKVEKTDRCQVKKATKRLRKKGKCSKSMSNTSTDTKRRECSSKKAKSAKPKEGEFILATSDSSTSSVSSTSSDAQLNVENSRGDSRKENPAYVAFRLLCSRITGSSPKDEIQVGGKVKVDGKENRQLHSVSPSEELSSLNVSYFQSLPDLDKGSNLAVGKDFDTGLVAADNPDNFGQTDGYKSLTFEDENFVPKGNQSACGDKEHGQVETAVTVSGDTGVNLLVPDTCVVSSITAEIEDALVENNGEVGLDQETLQFLYGENNICGNSQAKNAAYTGKVINIENGNYPIYRENDKNYDQHQSFNLFSEVGKTEPTCDVVVSVLESTYPMWDGHANDQFFDEESGTDVPFSFQTKTFTHDPDGIFCDDAFFYEVSPGIISVDYCAYKNQLVPLTSEEHQRETHPIEVCEPILQEPNITSSYNKPINQIVLQEHVQLNDEDLGFITQLTAPLHGIQESRQHDKLVTDISHEIKRLENLLGVSNGFGSGDHLLLDT